VSAKFVSPWAKKTMFGEILNHIMA